jgi:hypothetical protein
MAGIRGAQVPSAWPVCAAEQPWQAMAQALPQQTPSAQLLFEH